MIFNYDLKFSTRWKDLVLHLTNKKNKDALFEIELSQATDKVVILLDDEDQNQPNSIHQSKESK